jgi:hypothetical protein
MSSPLLLTVQDNVNAVPPSNWLRSTSATSIPLRPEEETSLRAARFPSLPVGGSKVLRALLRGSA